MACRRRGVPNTHHPQIDQYRLEGIWSGVKGQGGWWGGGCLFLGARPYLLSFRDYDISLPGIVPVGYEGGDYVVSPFALEALHLTTFPTCINIYGHPIQTL